MTDVSPFPDFDEYARPVGIFPLAREWVRYAGAPMRVNPDGTVVVSVGVSTSGQGLESMLITLTAAPYVLSLLPIP